MVLKLPQISIRYWVRRSFKATSLLVLLLTVCAHADMLICTDAKGKTIYTDNRASCRGNQAKSVKVDVSTPKNQTNEGIVNYRVPTRQYDLVGTSYKVYVERDLHTGDSQLADAATQKLEINLKEIFSVLPQKPTKQLSQLTFYLMQGEGSPKGGQKPNNYSHLDPRWENAIVIYSAKNLMYLDSLWSRKALMHELAHAWHLNNWPENYEPIVGAYRNAKEKGLYRDVKDSRGNFIKEAYAIKNHLEYFAELSAIYFVGGNYFPESRARLHNYDITGFNMINIAWGE
jgi:hypothetical protein